MIKLHCVKIIYVCVIIMAKKAVLVHRTPREAKAVFTRVIGCESLIAVYISHPVKVA